MKSKGFLAAKIVTLLAFIGFLVAIIYGVTQHDFFAEGNTMLSVFWGQFTMFDIYAAFIVFFVWVVIRERHFLKSVLWFVLIMLGGSMSICLYLFIALVTCNDDLKILLLGKSDLSNTN